MEMLFYVNSMMGEEDLITDFKKQVSPSFFPFGKEHLIISLSPSWQD